MSAPYVDEEAPLLGESESTAIPAIPPPSAATVDRIHWVDNLRAVLTALLIFHHAAIHTAYERLYNQSSKNAILSLALFITTNKSFLHALFFFLSGYSGFLALRSKSDLAFLFSRVVKLGLPIILYLLFGQWVLLKIAGTTTRPWGLTATRMEGPTPYVVLLLLLDSIYILTRHLGTRYPQYSFARLESRIKDSPRTINLLFLFSFALITLITLGNCFGLRLIPFIYTKHVSIEFPSFGAPVTYITAYIAGLNFPLFKRYILLSHPWLAAFILVSGEIFAYVALGITQHLSWRFWFFITPNRNTEGSRFFHGAGLNGETILFTLWNPLVLYTICIGTISLFASVPALNRDWGLLTRHTYTQTFVHMVPVALMAKVLVGTQVNGLVVVKALVSGLVGVVVSWGVGVGVWKIREVVVRRMGWRLPVDVEVRVRYAEEVPLVGGGDEDDLLGN